MADYPSYRYTMGFAVGSTAIPDPHVFTGAVSDLDTLGKRDATGYLHRNRVATKHPIKLEYHGIPWELIETICGLLTGDKFSFTRPVSWRRDENGTGVCRRSGMGSEKGYIWGNISWRFEVQYYPILKRRRSCYVIAFIRIFNSDGERRTTTHGLLLFWQSYFK